MSITLLPPVYNQMPLFQANQVLTYGHLNDLANYLYQQERYTRSKLIGSGIVCGLHFRWIAIAGGAAEVWIDDGIALTSAGYLMVYQQPLKDGSVIPFRHRRHFNRLNTFPPFNGLPPGNSPIFELITQTEFDEEVLVEKAALADTDRNGRVLVLLFDPEELKVAKCLDEGCDDKGKMIRYRIRPLLIPVAIMDAATNLTSEGRGWKATQSIRTGLDYIKMAPLLSGIALSAINTRAAFENIFVNRIDNNLLNAMSAQIQALLAAYPWLFNPALDCLKAENNELNNTSPGALFVSRATTFRNTAANRVHIQYLYDYVRDVAQAYNELYDAMADLIAECGGNEALHPFHVSLGIPLTNEVAPCFREQKFSEPNHRYRSHFIPSPLVAGQWQGYEKVQFLFKRLVRMIAEFHINAMSGPDMEITPSVGYENELAARALPFYYRHAAANPLVSVWNETLTRRNKTTKIKGYHLKNQAQLLDEDLAANDLYRIEGITGKQVDAVVNQINTIRTQYHLPFHLRAVPLVPEAAGTANCTWPDLQEDFGYYRDRVTGYLKEILQWWRAWSERFQKLLGKDFEMVGAHLEKMLGLLKEFRCIEKFPYAEWKRLYADLWRILFELYARQQAEDNDTTGSFHFLNSLINAANIFFFAPIYKIWYAFQHRIMILQQAGNKSLSGDPSVFVGLEHLAGVRRGHTFLLVYAGGQDRTVIGDFNVPMLPDCDCGCKASPCKGEGRVRVSPLEKPVMMVVMPDYAERLTAQNPDMAYPLSKMVAWYNEKDQQYELRLDEMGFYKAQSHIEPEVEILSDAGTKSSSVKGVWDKDALLIIFKADEKRLTGGVQLLNYSLKGDFEGSLVTGRLILIVAGVLAKVVDEKKRETVLVAELASTAPAKNFYPYDTTVQPARKYKISVDFPVQTVNLGNERVRSFNTPGGSQLGILTDEKGNDYIRVLKAGSAGVEDISFVLSSGSDTIKSSFTLNIVNTKERLESDKIAGIVKDDKGNPVANARVLTAAGKEVFTNEKGEYLLEGIKAGEVLKIESRDHAVVNLQVNKTMDKEITLQPNKTNVVNVLEKVEVPDVVKTIARNLTIGGISGPNIRG